MPSFLIEGGQKLKGEVTASGNKNAALPLMSAVLMTDQPVMLHNLPEIGDVKTMRDLLRSLGVQIEHIKGHTWRFHAAEVHRADLDPDLCRRIRASILLAGPLLNRTGGLDLPPPGGDVIGRRRLDTHILALERLGAGVDYNEREFSLTNPGRLQGTPILLDEASVTATENALMAAVMAEGETVLRNAASEPHVQDLCHMLNAMGGKIENIGSNTLHIQGVSTLHGAEFEIGADYLEVMSYVTAAAVTGGEVRIRNANPEHLGMIQLVFDRLGIHWESDEDSVIIRSDQKMTIEPDLGGFIPEISVMPWPAFPTDLVSIAIVLATQCKGTVLFHDWMYPSRMFFIDKLVSMGARIILCDPHRCIVEGPAKLVGEFLESPDIRAGMALVLAALAAQGESLIRNIGQIERGYERIDEKLRSLGAKITRVEEG
jgi:UDP-N-acetylglucosamine 1-carboxyvinyltransferase